MRFGLPTRFTLVGQSGRRPAAANEIVGQSGRRPAAANEIVGQSGRRPAAAIVTIGLLFGLLGSGCVTVRPEQRAIHADPTMQFDRGREDLARQHVLENREGSYGGGSV